MSQGIESRNRYERYVQPVAKAFGCGCAHPQSCIRTGAAAQADRIEIPEPNTHGCKRILYEAIDSGSVLKKFATFSQSE
jgi:hypothetical protein